MDIGRVIRTGLMLTALAVAVTGCQYYWGKPGATPAQFGADTTDCAREASQAQTAGDGSSSEKTYRACMRSRGWARDKRPDPPGEGWFRGIEKWD